MKLENWQLLALAIAGFASIVILDLAVKYRTDEGFRKSFPTLNKAQFAQSIAPQLQHEEQTAVPYINTDEAVGEDQ